MRIEKINHNKTTHRLYPAILLSGVLLIISTTMQAADLNGVVKIKSNHSVTTTIDRLEHILQEKGMVIFKRINHSAGAEKAGIKLRPTELLIFGNPKVGTPLMLCSQTTALDLPQKALAFKDEKGQVWLSYNAPSYLSQRHQLKGCEKQIQKIRKALKVFTSAATE